MGLKTRKASTTKELANTLPARRIREGMDDAGITTKMLAEYIGCAPQAVNQYRQGLSNPTYPNLLKIATRLGVTTDYLLGRAKAKAPENEQTMQRLGLTEAAIQTLKVMHENVKDDRGSGAMVAGINLLLSTEIGREILNDVGAYLLLDFDRAYETPGIYKTTDELNFLPVPEAASYGVVPNLCATIKTERLGTALVTSIGISLQLLREDIHHVNQEDSK